MAEMWAKWKQNNPLASGLPSKPKAPALETNYFDGQCYFPQHAYEAASYGGE